VTASVVARTAAARPPVARVPDAVAASLAAGSVSFSFELFPPRDDAAEGVLWRTLHDLEALAPSFVSVTYGAGGSSRDRTVRLTHRIAAETTLLPLAHLTAVGHSVAELRRILGEYAAGGVGNVLALRGDPPGDPQAEWTAHPEGLSHAEDLVRLAGSVGDFSIGVAAFPTKHPRSPDVDADARVLAGKVRAGASYAITQMFFEVDQYLTLRDRVARLGVDVPILAGVMPVTRISQVDRFAALVGEPLPRAFTDRLSAAAGDPAAVRAVGVEFATAMCQRLVAEGVPGLHFITLNRSTATVEVFDALGLRRPAVGRTPACG